MKVAFAWRREDHRDEALRLLGGDNAGIYRIRSKDKTSVCLFICPGLVRPNLLEQVLAGSPRNDLYIFTHQESSSHGTSACRHS